MVEGWKGQFVKLVPMDFDRHFENAYAWLNDPEVTEHLLIGDFPITRLAEKEYFERERPMVQPGDINFAVELHSGEHIGFSGLHLINYHSGYATTGTVLGRKDLWGKGYGTDAALVRAHFAFHIVGLRRLFSSVIEGSDRSLNMQLRIGYEIYGRAPLKYWKRGRYRDEILTVLTRERWLELNPQ
jgi:RimJ/RimL family protein N-acetyltransferase